MPQVIYMTLSIRIYAVVRSEATCFSAQLSAKTAQHTVKIVEVTNLSRASDTWSADVVSLFPCR